MDEPERLASLRSLEILDTGSEQAFDRLTQLAAGALDAPIAAVALVDEARVWLKSRVGTEVRETRRDDSFCSHAMASSELFVVEDASSDDRFKTSPLVTQHRVRFYAGAPIKLATGAVVGAVCILDVEPRARPSAAALGLLEGLAIAAGHLLDLRRQLVLRRDTENALREHARFLELAEEMAEIGTWRLDFASGTVDHSPAANKIYGFQNLETKRAICPLLAMYDPLDRTMLIASTEEAKRTGRGFSFDAKLRRVNDGALRDVRGKTSVEVDGAGRPIGLVGVFRDVTVEKKAFDLLKEQHAEADRRAFRLGQLASTDVLTALPNRRAFLDHVERVLARGTGSALAILDLDHFKAINDRYGHDAGDSALNAFGRMCHRIVDGHCVAGRIGGEEFALLLMNLDEDGLSQRVETLRTTTTTTPVVTRDGFIMRLTFSAGLAAIRPGDDWHSLFQRADRALYLAKNQGRDRTAIAA